MTTKKPTATAMKPSVGKALAKPAAKPATAIQAGSKLKKERKVKVVRDSFTMPEGEYLKIAEIKDICAKAGQPVKKSEVLRAGLKALAAMNPAQLKRALAGLEKIKTGRPKKP
jgi:hypothetical protein